MTVLLAVVNANSDRIVDGLHTRVKGLRVKSEDNDRHRHLHVKCDYSVMYCVPGCQHTGPIGYGSSLGPRYIKLVQTKL